LYKRDLDPRFVHQSSKFEANNSINQSYNNQTSGIYGAKMIESQFNPENLTDDLFEDFKYDYTNPHFIEDIKPSQKNKNALTNQSHFKSNEY
jgi:hypothetical protein